LAARTTAVSLFSGEAWANTPWALGYRPVKMEATEGAVQGAVAMAQLNLRWSRAKASITGPPTLLVK